jgi:hypothetical protein
MPILLSDLIRDGHWNVDTVGLHSTRISTVLLVIDVSSRRYVDRAAKVTQK